LASPVVDALLDRYPGAQLTWVVQSKSVAVVRGLPGLHETLLWDDKRSPWVSLLRALWRARRARFDIVLDLQGLDKAGLFMLASGAKRRISGASAHRIALLNSTERVPDETRNEPIHARLFYLRRAARLDLAPDAAARFFPRVPISAAHRRFADGFLAQAGWTASHRVIGLNLGASNEEKRWPAERFAQLADALLKSDEQTRIVVFGAPADKKLLERFENELARCCSDNTQANATQANATQASATQNSVDGGESKEQDSATSASSGASSRAKKSARETLANALGSSEKTMRHSATASDNRAAKNSPANAATSENANETDAPMIDATTDGTTEGMKSRDAKTRDATKDATTTDAATTDAATTDVAAHDVAAHDVAAHDVAAHDAVPGGAWRGRVAIAVGRVDLLQLAAIAERSAAIVSADTGPMHIVAAVGAPLVALFGPTDIVRTGPVQNPDGAPIRVLDARALTGLPRAPMTALEVNDVLREIRILTGQSDH